MEIALRARALALLAEAAALPSEAVLAAVAPPSEAPLAAAPPAEAAALAPSEAVALPSNLATQCAPLHAQQDMHHRPARRTGYI